MRAVKITETDYGQWIVETSSGVRSASATLEGALEKAMPLDVARGFEEIEVNVLHSVFAGIRPTNTGQIRSGQAGA